MTRDCHAGICGSRRVRPPPATRQDKVRSLSRLKARGEISLKMANGGEFATSMRIRWTRLNIRRA